MVQPFPLPFPFLFFQHVVINFHFILATKQSNIMCISFGTFVMGTVLFIGQFSFTVVTDFSLL